MTGIIEIDGIFYIMEDGQRYYFDETDSREGSSDDKPLPFLVEQRT